MVISFCVSVLSCLIFFFCEKRPKKYYVAVTDFITAELRWLASPRLRTTPATEQSTVWIPSAHSYQSLLLLPPQQQQQQQLRTPGVGERWGGKVGGRVERERKKKAQQFLRIQPRRSAHRWEEAISYKIRRPSISDMKSEWFNVLVFSILICSFNHQRLNIACSPQRCNNNNNNNTSSYLICIKTVTRWWRTGLFLLLRHFFPPLSLLVSIDEFNFKIKKESTNKKKPDLTSINQLSLVKIETRIDYISLTISRGKKQNSHLKKEILFMD